MSTLPIDNMSAEVAERIEYHADAILKASGSALRYFTLPAVRRAILEACLELHDEAFLAGFAARSLPTGPDNA